MSGKGILRGKRVSKNRVLNVGLFLDPTSLPALKERLRSKGKTESETESELQRRKFGVVKTRRFLRKELFKGGNTEPPTVWTSTDMSTHSFMYKDEEYTVAKYFEDVVKVPLRFPHLPMLHMGSKNGYFPVEFLFQAFGGVESANSDDQVRMALAFNDDFPGTERLHHLSGCWQIVQELQMKSTTLDQRMILQSFDLQIKQEPLQTTVSVIGAPELVVAGRRSVCESGSWNLHNTRSIRPSELCSLAYVDLSGPDQRSRQSRSSFFGTLFEQMQVHGMGFLRNLDPLETVDRLTVKVGPNASPSEVSFVNVFLAVLES